MPASFNVDDFRANFPSLPRLTYLNSGSYGLLAHRVREALNGYMDRRVEVGADWGGWVGTLEDVRGRMAALLAVDADEIAITGSASAGLNALASAFDFRSGRNRIVVSNFEFPTSAQIWHAQEAGGAELVHVPEGEEARLPLEHFERVIDERTAIVAISQLCYRHGGRIPDDDIRAIARMAHAHGALVVLDSYQIVGTEIIHPRELDVDVCVGGMLKYLLGTAGIGFMYVRASLISQLEPRTSGWFAQADTDAMDIFASKLSGSARRFEAGTPPVPSCVATSAGLSLVLDTGLEQIAGQVRRITRQALDALAEADILFINPAEDKARGPLISIPSVDETQLVDVLARQNIITSCRDGKVRAGFHAYNDEGDVERFVSALARRRELLGTNADGARVRY